MRVAKNAVVGLAVVEAAWWKPVTPALKTCRANFRTCQASSEEKDWSIGYLQDQWNHCVLDKGEYEKDLNQCSIERNTCSDDLQNCAEEADRAWSQWQSCETGYAAEIKKSRECAEGLETAVKDAKSLAEKSKEQACRAFNSAMVVMKEQIRSRCNLCNNWRQQSTVLKEYKAGTSIPSCDPYCEDSWGIEHDKMAKTFQDKSDTYGAPAMSFGCDGGAAAWKSGGNCMSC